MTPKEIQESQTEVQRIVENADEGSNAKVLGSVILKLLASEMNRELKAIAERELADLQRVPGES